MRDSVKVPSARSALDSRGVRGKRFSSQRSEYLDEENARLIVLSVDADDMSAIVLVYWMNQLFQTSFSNYTS